MRWTCTILLGAAAATSVAARQPAPRQNGFAPDGTPIALGLAGYAKVLCSMVFVSGRDAAEVFENSGFVRKQPVYGGLFWVNGDGAWPIPKSAYFAKGAGGQRTVIIPTHDVVVV